MEPIDLTLKENSNGVLSFLPRPSSSKNSKRSLDYPLEEITHYEKNYETKGRSDPKSLISFNFDTHDDSDSSENEFDLSKMPNPQRSREDDDDAILQEPSTSKSPVIISPQRAGEALNESTFTNVNDTGGPGSKVSRVDIVFSLLFFASALGQFISDFALAVWHYRNGFMWASGLNATFMILGSIGVLHQFNLYQYEHIKRIFNAGKRTRILVNCFPPITLILGSYELTKVGLKSRGDQMMSGRFNEIEDFLKGCTRIQSFCQAAPLTILQIVVLLEDIFHISPIKASFTGLNIFLNLCVMTIANMPSRTDTDAIKTLSKSSAAKIFIGVQMFSSFASREMAVAYFFIALRCLLTPSAQVWAFFLGSSFLIIPRAIFGILDFLQTFILSSSSVPEQNSLKNTLFGYFATIFFPVGDPFWTFCFVWVETALFLLFGNITGWATTPSCIPTLVNSLYTGLSLIVLVVIPIIIPFIRAQVRRREMERLAKGFRKRARPNNATVRGSGAPNPKRDRRSIEETILEEDEEPC